MRRSVGFWAGLGMAAGVLLVGVGVALWASPPDLLRVGSQYAAKMVCSNTFIAGRDPEEVLRIDVQAPGHPILKAIRVRVDREAGEVHANLFGFIGGGLAVWRPGVGCTTVSDQSLTLVKGLQLPPNPPDSRTPEQAWPEGEGLAPNPAVQALLEQDALTGPGMRAVLVVHQGKLIAERYGEGFSVKTPLLGWSMTKTVTAMLIGRLIQEGRLSLDQTELLSPRTPSDGREKIPLSSLLSMDSGLHFNEEYGDVSDVTRMLYLEPDMAQFVAAQALDHPVGAVFNYSSGTSVLLTRLWQDRLGGSALEYPRQALFGPLGLRSAVLETDARGTFVGSSYLYATGQDWARLGWLLAQGGRWNGEQLLPEGYVQWMATPSAASKGEYGQGQVWRWGPQGQTPEGQNPNLAFVLPDDLFLMRGHDGQTVSIMPSRGLVVVRMGLTPSKLKYQPQPLVEAILKTLPQESGPTPASVEAAAPAAPASSP